MMKNLSPRAQRLIIALAQDEAYKFGSEQLLPEHVILAMLRSGDGLGYLTLKALRINVLTLQLTIEQVCLLGYHFRPHLIFPCRLVYSLCLMLRL